MFAILKKEFNSFFATPIGYLVVAIFLITNGLFLWVFDNPFNVLNAGFADLTGFFFLAPWIFLFLIPAVTMRSFSEEYNSGTIEVLKTKPLTNWNIIFGKYAANFLVILISILPTLVYVYTIYQLSFPVGNLDVGVLIGSYIGVLFLASSYTAIGIFSSTISSNQIVSFIISVSICFSLFYGFEAMASLFGNSSFEIQQLGMKEHFKSISRGVIDTRDLVYFIGITVFFLFLTKFKLDSE